MAVNELDAKTRAVEKMRAEPGKEMSTYQAAENQLLAIRAEQKQNLALARQEGAANLQQNATMGQAAELAAASSGGGTVQAPVNAATQNVLAKYGAGPTITKSTQRSTQQVTKQNITINNYNNTTNNTTNNVPNTGPVQGRPVVVNRDDTGRFKVWVNNVIARQNEQAAIRDKEYQRRESALTRSANKMTRKLEAISSNISKNLDPRRLNNDLAGQLKKVLMLVGLGVIASNWPKVLNLIGNIEKKVRAFFRYVGISDRGERQKTGADSGIVRDLKYILLGDRAKEVKGGLMDALKLFFMGEGGLLDTVKKSFKLWLDNRSKALKAVKAPKFSILRPGEGIKSVITYLGQILGVLLEGPGGALKSAAEDARKEGAEKLETNKEIYHSKSGYKTASGKSVSYGDAASAIHDVDSAGAKYHLMHEDVKEDGSLKNNLGSSLRQSAYLADNFSGGKATGGKINVTGIMEGLSRLEKTANTSKDKTTLVDPKFIKALEKLGVNIESLKLNDKVKEFGYVARKKTEDEKAEEFAQNSGIAKAVGWTSGITAGTLTAFLASGGGIKAAGSVTAGALVGDEVKKRAEEWAQKQASEEYVFQLAPRGKYKDEQYYNLKQEAGNKKFFQYYELTNEDMKAIKDQLGKLTGMGENFSYAAEDIASTRAMAEMLLKKNPDKQLDDSYAANMQKLAQLEGEMADYKAAQKDIWDNSIMSGMGQRAAEVGRKGKEFATTGYTKSIGGDDTDYSSVRETANDVIDRLRYSVDDIKEKTNWNVDKAVDTIKRNANSESIGSCLRYTGNAISSGFDEGKSIVNYHTSEDPNMGGITSAKFAGAALEALGFERIPNDSLLQKGDIHVYQPTTAWSNEGHPHGHIEMFDGNSWYSDFKQKTSGANWGHYASMATYRWKGENSDSDVVESTDDVPVNQESPMNTIRTEEALAVNTNSGTTPSTNTEEATATPTNPGETIPGNLTWSLDGTGNTATKSPVDVTIPLAPSTNPVATPTIENVTPLLAQTKFSPETIAKTSTLLIGELNKTIKSGFELQGSKMDDLISVTFAGAQASADGVTATREVTAAVVASATPTTSTNNTRSGSYTSSTPSGNV